MGHSVSCTVHEPNIQCDHILQESTTLVRFSKPLAIFEGLISIWQNFIVLGKFSLL